jgi:hypothetical protein
MQDVELTPEILDTIEEIIFSGEFLMAIEMLRNLRTTDKKLRRRKVLLKNCAEFIVRKSLRIKSPGKNTWEIFYNPYRLRYKYPSAAMENWFNKNGDKVSIKM